MAADDTPHDWTPAGDAAERAARLRLYRCHGVGPRTWVRLMAEHGSAVDALAALPDRARAAGVNGYKLADEGWIEREARAARACGARLATLGDAGFPAALRDWPDCAPVLWIRGEREVFDRPAVALVGARNASSLGTRFARRLAADLGKAGIVVVSGLARGIDAAAHAGALDTGTVAALAGGVDVVTPLENTDLEARIRQTGAVLSDRPIGLQPGPRDFPRRNRMIAGLSRAVVVVEAAARSGSLITARHAADRGRDVMAVPGHPIDPRASGCNHLLRDGAILVRGAEDVIEALAEPACGPARGESVEKNDMPAAPPVDAGGAPGAQTGTADVAAALLARLTPTPVPQDELIRDLGAPPRLVAEALSRLELEGRAARHGGGKVALAV